jgi:hypothetical protein
VLLLQPPSPSPPLPPHKNDPNALAMYSVQPTHDLRMDGWMGYYSTMSQKYTFQWIPCAFGISVYTPHVWHNTVYVMSKWYVKFITLWWSLRIKMARKSSRATAANNSPVSLLGISGSSRRTNGISQKRAAENYSLFNVATLVMNRLSITKCCTPSLGGVWASK